MAFCFYSNAVPSSPPLRCHLGFCSLEGSLAKVPAVILLHSLFVKRLMQGWDSFKDSVWEVLFRGCASVFFPVCNFEHFMFYNLTLELKTFIDQIEQQSHCDHAALFLHFQYNHEMCCLCMSCLCTNGHFFFFSKVS